jgi:hypothetical protein
MRNELVLAGARVRQLSGDEMSVDKRDHYKVICVSLYNDDLLRLDAMVEELKERGFTKASRSALIRFALDSVDLNKVKKGM